MTIPKELKTLVERFEQNREAYCSNAYNETQLRREFLDPFFKALGWDVDNKQGYAEAYKEVVHEDAVKVGGATKAPDYSFRIGGVRKFFVEAKRPSVGIKNNAEAAYQLRRYAWSAKLPLSILTDFEEFAVYDCRSQPNKNDKASTARTLYFTYQDYEEKWDEIAAIFSPESIRKGSFDKYVESTKRKRGTAEVDDAFLKEIETWRDVLARNIALRNPKLTNRELNFAVQRTIDRIIFLRICEDRGIEEYGQLMALQNGTNSYKRLAEIFRRADERYNSGLFHFRKEKDRGGSPDEWTLSLKIDDPVLKSIFKKLYYPESPYEFSVLPADILGHIYEQFLGKVIRLTPAHRAVVEEKPEVRKAGGVYYTPTYIVDYIVEHTVGKLLEGKTPKQVEKLRILDPACGSGSFLLGAYQRLLDWHRDHYVEKGPDKVAKGRSPKLFQGRGGEWRLTTAEKKRILLNNIYGVDIDPQAVEVTKLSLLLKVLEGENAETIGKNLKLFHERALPDLGDNIKCGNSLIGPDFYDDKQLSLIDEEERYRINAFDWNAEFPDIMQAGGFDAVIGNPPYIRVRSFRNLYPQQTAYLEARYKCAAHVWDVYLLFFEQAVEITRQRGRIAFIVPIQTLHQPNCESLRTLLLDQTRIRYVTDLSRLRVFRKAIVKNCILVCEKGNPGDACVKAIRPATPEELETSTFLSLPQQKVLSNPGHSLKVDLLSPKRDLCERLRGQSWTLGQICYVTFGLRSCAKGKGRGGKDRLITPNPHEKHAKPYLEGRDIHRYQMMPTGRFIRYLPEEMYSPRVPELFETQKIISQSMLSQMRLVATFDNAGFYTEQSLVCIIPHGVLSDAKSPITLPLEYLLGIINSRLQSFYFATWIIDFSLGGGLIHATPGAQKQLLIPRPGEAQTTRMVELVESMLKLHKDLQTAKTDHDKKLTQRQIDATDKQIDQLVYELYGLTDKEIKIVEEATS